MSEVFPRVSARLLPLAIALSIASPSVLAQDAKPNDAATQRALIERLEALERHLGVTGDAGADSVPGDAADLDRRLRVIERRLELQAEENAAKAAKDPVVSLAANRGLSIKSPDGLELRLRGVVQADGRFFVGDERVPQNDTFLFRRIRPSLEGTWGSLVGFRLTPEFAGDSTTIVDAYVDLKFDPRATVRIGKVKGPVGLERLQSASGIALVERGFPTELAPNRDLGVQLQGDLFGNRLNYVVGVYNGAPDGRDAATTNVDNEFEYAGRVFWEPFKNSANAWSGLGVGVAASVGETFGAGNNVLPRYRTPGQVQFFGYGANVVGDGLRRRFSPQGYYYGGRFGVLGEYITSEQEVRIASGIGAGRREHLEHEAWQLTGSVVLTGEDASYRGVAKPDRPFTVGGEGWGAFELVGRYGELSLDDATFPLFANPATSARASRAWTLGLNWYLNSNLKLVANYTEASFDGGAAAGADREDEKSIFTRAQFSF
ncbi:OprO/OprP family phosphate-selective porin [Lysobacter brunescens]|uniref:OprO/OprP family phosphate-selective porin n=1 Tax=Lysobacter brunescens TaxID=262323 RepID=A0ABW2YDA6_9GAMM